MILFGSNVGPLSGLLGVGYFLHPCSIPIVRKNRNQANNERDLSIGFTLVFLTYTVIGVFGYIGFSGRQFEQFASVANPENWPIAQNCMMMFDQANWGIFIMRLLIFYLVSSSYPILNHFLRMMVVKLVHSDDERIDESVYAKVTIFMNLIPLAITLFYPQMAKILNVVGTVTGVIVIYYLPILTHLAKLKAELDKPSEKIFRE